MVASLRWLAVGLCRTVTGTGTSYSSYWVGIDGFNSSTVEQIGTAVSKENRRANVSLSVSHYRLVIEIRTRHDDLSDALGTINAWRQTHQCESCPTMATK